tara:strand:+ start:1113 stop:1319 length:207 start_codon:yes stop_codon:yes gene_type:complete
MTIGDIIKTLVNTDNYFEERGKISDTTIKFIKTTMSFDYQLFEEKENDYQSFILNLKNGLKDLHNKIN